MTETEHAGRVPAGPPRAGATRPTRRAARHRRAAHARPAPRGGRHAGRASAPTTTCGWSRAATATRRRRCSRRWPGCSASTRPRREYLLGLAAVRPRHRRRPRREERPGRHPAAARRDRAARPSSRTASSTCSPPTGWPRRCRPRSGRARTGCARCSSTRPSGTCYPDWDKAIGGMVAAFRASIGTDTDDPRIAQLVGELSLASEPFRRLWARHDVPLPGPAAPPG